MQLPQKADLVIIGGGVIGCFICRELSRYQLDIVLVEKEADVSCGTTKANTAMIHPGIGSSLGTLKSKLERRGNPMYTRVCQELAVPFQRCGMLLILIQWKFLYYLLGAHLKAKLLRIPVEFVGRKRLFEMEPHLNKAAKAGISFPSTGIISPYKLTIALAENAIENGAKVLLGTEVKDIILKEGRVNGVVTNQGTIQTSWVINAAGVYADKIAELAGAKEYRIHPRKGTHLVFDKKLEGYIKHCVMELRKIPRAHTKGGGIMPTVDGNILWGPTAEEIDSKEDASVTAEDIDTILNEYASVLPDFPKQMLISYFAGIRAPTEEEDFVIKPADKVKGFLHVGGIQSPGLAAAPAIAEMALNLLEKKMGLLLKAKENFNPYQKAPVVFSKLSEEKKRDLIKQNPLYGHIICRCEQVSEGEIVDALHRPLPVTTLDGLKRRVRVGMGRCQGGFCTPWVARIMARELKIPLLEITKKGPGSELFVGEPKHL